MFGWKRKEDLFVRGTTQFALDLLQKLTTQGSNLFFSPYIISALLAMVYAGARGNTAAEMAEALHFPFEHEKLHVQIADLHERLLAATGKGHYELRMGSRLWSQIGYRLLPSFLDLVTQYYRCGVEQVDFFQGDQVCKAINHWAEDETAGLIKNVVDQGMFNLNTRMVLTSAIYFKGFWLDPFEKRFTKDDDFWIAPQKSVRTSMMFQRMEVAYADYSDLQVVSLPYRHHGERQNPEVSMIVLLPKMHEGLDKLSAQLIPGKLEEWLNGLQLREIMVFLPRFQIESSYDLSGPLSELGMRNAFDRTNADFTGIVQTDEPFWIEGLIQKAYVKVNEVGTEAAAVAATVLWASSGGKIPPTPVFRADHPFLFLIRHNHSGTILFLGRVNNPQT